jgi:hypothetical protein
MHHPNNTNHSSNTTTTLDKLQTPTLSLIETYLNTNNNSPTERIPSSCDINTDITTLKQIYNSKLKEIDTLYQEILAKDDKIAHLTTTTHDTYKSKPLPNLPPKRSKKINDIEKDNNEQLKQSLNKLKDEFNEQIQSINIDHDKKVKQLKNEIHTLKQQLDIYQDKTKYISKEEHELILSELKLKHKKELEPFEKEISELEKFLTDNYPNIILNNTYNTNNNNNNSNNTITNNIDNDYLNLCDTK